MSNHLGVRLVQSAGGISGIADSRISLDLDKWKIMEFVEIIGNHQTKMQQHPNKSKSNLFMTYSSA